MTNFATSQQTDLNMAKTDDRPADERMESWLMRFARWCIVSPNPHANNYFRHPVTGRAIDEPRTFVTYGANEAPVGLEPPLTHCPTCRCNVETIDARKF
jgi:hypothetical protein